ncbi:MAG: CpXC domain-containing protein [Clostridia bacterium]|nr:CpXC domain-containing protein [Clostridia bacterium]
MAMRDKVTVKCPGCGKSLEVEQWSAVNGDKNPQQKLKILNGTLFTVTCTKCGRENTVGYPLLYSDPKVNCMIWLVYDDDEVKHITDYYKASKTEISETNEDVDKECRQRIVRDAHRLREKIMIFDSNFDDKIIEIAKLGYAQSAQRQIGSEKIAAAFFSNEGGENRIEMYTESGQAFVSKLSRDIYNQLEDKYGGKASYAEDRVYVIDDVWAMSLVLMRNS